MAYDPQLDELIVTVDPYTGIATGAVSKVRAHAEGIWHATIHCWILDENRQLIFQHRALNKPTFPGLWDISAAGHLRPGEDGLREIKEELGADVTMNELTLVGVLSVDQRDGDLINRERPRVYLWDSKRPLDSFSFPDGEVTALASLTIAQLHDLLRSEEVFVQGFDARGLYDSSLHISDVVPLSNAYWRQLLTALYRTVPAAQLGIIMAR
jgi:isopentenyldiphosphate isomerase